MNRLDLVSSHLASDQKILVWKQGGIGMIEMSSQKDKNCLSNQMMEELCRALKSHSSDPTIKVILLTSKVDKAFCAGADIKEFLKHDPESYLNAEIFNVIEEAFRETKKPVIASVDGYALGGGFELALLADIILCSPRARFALPEITLGLIPGIGGTQRLAKLIGPNRTMSAVLTGEGFSGEEANRLGIATLIQDPFSENCLAFARKISEKSVSALIVGKRAVKQSSNMTLDQGLMFEKSTFYPLLTTRGAKEGISAFIEKRKPDFSNK